MANRLQPWRAGAGSERWRQASSLMSLLVFFQIWAKRMRRDVPDIHVRAVKWLETKEPDRQWRSLSEPNLQ